MLLWEEILVLLAMYHIQKLVLLQAAGQLMIGGVLFQKHHDPKEMARMGKWLYMIRVDDVIPDFRANLGSNAILRAEAAKIRLVAADFEAGNTKSQSQKQIVPVSSIKLGGIISSRQSKLMPQVLNEQCIQRQPPRE